MFVFSLSSKTTTICVFCISFLENEVFVEIQNVLDIPQTIQEGYTIKISESNSSYLRMENALRDFREVYDAVSDSVHSTLLGHTTSKQPFAADLPDDYSAPGLPRLNPSQAAAVKAALQSSFSLIQGPPGTGKTVSSASLVYHMAQQENGPVLVCAPSNIATDQLCSIIHQTGLRVRALVGEHAHHFLAIGSCFVSVFNI